MKINYQIEMEKIIASLKAENGLPKLLLHSCCGPCSTYVLEYLTKYFDIAVFFYNPNIFPREEYEKRKLEQIQFIEKFPFENSVEFIDCDFEEEIFYNAVKGLENEREGGERCFKCYEFRLEKTAEFAKINNFDYFASTLTVSPYKNSAKVNEFGFIFSEKYEVSYLPSDFKKKNGYKRSIQLSADFNVYRQDYCGCVYSARTWQSKIW